jgi:hypothetical protein
MIHDDKVIGFPQVPYKNTTANIEALTGVGEGAMAYSTDDNVFGTYNGATWDWATGGGDVSTDAIWDAKGDIAGGTGANAAAALPVGADGQVLTANSGAATGLAWAAAGSGDMANDALWDAKGDLAAGTGANAGAKLSVGTNGKVLTAASGEATGLAWADTAYHAFSGCALTKSATQNINTATETAVSFDGEVYDTDAYHDNSTNPSRFTAPATGYYLVGGSAEVLDIDDGKYVIVRIRKGGTNASGDGRGRIYSSGAAQILNVPFMRRVPLNAGEYVELTIEHNNGDTQVVRESTNGTSFWIVRVA